MNDPAPPLAGWRERLREGRERLRADFAARPAPERLLARHARLVDEVVRGLWRDLAMPRALALVAVGGYGRGRLFPHSDVDVLVLVPDGGSGWAAPSLERLLGALWDVGLELGRSARTVEECLTEMRNDATVRTSLLEHRWLAGDRALFRRFCAAFAADLDPRAFFQAKALEQQQRHARFQDATYNLEPNLKESPGGLRDLQTVLWIARAAGLGASWAALARGGLVTREEAREIVRTERTLAGLRIRLHLLSGRREDRLVFDVQTRLAAALGLADTPHRRASELLMQRYYRAAKAVRHANVILLQNLHTRLFPQRGEAMPVNERFRAVDELLDVRDEALFAGAPGAMLESFNLLQRHPELKGMTARTLRALWRHRTRIDARFRRETAHREAFLAILREPRGVFHEVRRMNQYGILGRYIPAFGRIVGQMQHDLFHVYTVDEHSLMVLRNLRRFTESQYAHEYPLCSRLIADFERREVLYLAALFHDIAKGRGGDHSLLGAVDARRFCRAHALAPEDTDLVAWLVENHLVMSATAQKQDIADPAVVAAFARRAGTERRLAALYLLTVADVRGTSPRVWNAWKARLLEDLFHLTRRALSGEDPNLHDSLEARQEQARALLRAAAAPEGIERRLWSKLDTVYFQRHSVAEIAWHARLFGKHVDTPDPIVRARPGKPGEGLQICVYLPDQRELFSRICSFLGRHRYTIVEAKVHTTRHGYALDTFVVMDPDNPGVSYRDVVSFIEYELADRLARKAPVEPVPPGRVSRQLRHFPITPEVTIVPDDRGVNHILEIVAGDRPGLLARVAAALAAHEVSVHSARINTLGERAEDVFLVSGAPLHDEHRLLQLETDLLRALEG